MYDYIHYAEFCFLGAGILALLMDVYLQSQHLKECPRIHAEVQIREFRGFVRLQMLLSIIFVMAVVPAIVLVFLEKPGLPMTLKLGLLAPYGVMVLMIVQIKRGLHQIRDTSRCAPAYVSEFERVCTLWRNKFLPLF